MAFWSRITSLIAGGAVATAASDGVRPVLEPVRQHAWSRNKLRVLDLETTARLVAQAIIAEGAAEEEAGRIGFGPNRLRAIVKLLQTMPGQSQLDNMLNRHTIDRALFDEALAKHQVDPRFWDALFDLTNDKLSVSEVANAVQQGHMPNDGILPSIEAAVTPAHGAVTPTAPDGQPPSSVPLTQIDLDPIKEAEAQGYDLTRLRIAANLAGLPPGPEALLTMWNRELIDEASVDAGIREGHMKTKWAGAFKRMRWAVLSPQDYASARLRQWVTAEESYAGGALTGHTKEQMDLLFLNRGRPASPTQMWRAWARKIVGPRGVPVAFEDHAKAIAISDIRPEYAEMLWGIRFNYPSLFQLGRLVQSGAITPDTAVLWASYNLYGTDVTDTLKVYWDSIYPGSVGTSATAADPNLKKAHTKAWTEAQTSYIAGESTEADVQPIFTLLGIDQAAAAEIVSTWNDVRSLVRKQLSPKEIQKAIHDQVTNPATGQPWTPQEAISALQARGYDLADATVLVDEA